MSDSYKVCALDITTEFTEKKSRFISTLKCVETEDEAKNFIESIRKQYKDATHNCYAYRLREPRIERFSDDGEPAGTAGMPILEVLKKENVYNVCIVVTRYFGGILLGGGGLIRAYGKGSSNAVSTAGFAYRDACVNVAVRYNYSGHARVLKLLETTVHNELACDFGADVCLSLSVRADGYDVFIKSLNDILCGDVKINVLSNDFDNFKNN